MAIAALVLSFFGFFAIAGLVLGIIVLATGRPGRSLAIGGIVVSLLILVPYILATLGFTLAVLLQYLEVAP